MVYVSRDGSQTYASAIRKALPKAEQISDRFHILKNLNEAICDYINNIFSSRIEIPMTKDTKQLKIDIGLGELDGKIENIKKLRKLGKSDKEISNITGIHTRTVKNTVKAQMNIIILLEQKSTKRYSIKLKKNQKEQKN